MTIPTQAGTLLGDVFGHTFGHIYGAIVEVGVALTAVHTNEGTLPSLSPNILEEAHQRAVTATPAEMASHLQELLGQKLTALIAGVENPKTVGKWARGQEPHPTNLVRIRDTFQIATLLELATSRQTVRSWFMGMNPSLNDRAPALVLADEPNAAQQVMRAARGFLAHG